MTARERQWRSKLAQLVSQHGVVRGSLQVRERRCGKSNCRCADGQGHRSLYLILSKQGKIHQLYVPKRWEAAVRQWVDNYHNVRDLLEEISELHWNKVENRQE